MKAPAQRPAVAAGRKTRRPASPAAQEAAAAALAPAPARRRAPGGEAGAPATPAAPPATAAPAAAAAAGAAARAPAEAATAVRVLRQFRRVFNSVKSHFQQVEKRSGLGGAQVWALSVVRDRPGIGVNELARALDVRQPTASNLVKSLAAQDCIEVRRDQRDGRAVTLHLRPAGGRVLRRAPGPFTGVLPEALASLDARTLTRLEKDLAALIDRLGADERGAGIPLSQI